VYTQADQFRSLSLIRNNYTSLLQVLHFVLLKSLDEMKKMINSYDFMVASDYYTRDFAASFYRQL
jgi:hypothetical protein